ncbi:actin-binding Rho-activating protein-like [Ylistrum balloti]|uniref:actin-binding Rho-activating protein-like n=1 Tax=Ylistrum balloti TaxID=509963 RepID=UPI002905D742|nr:actin-binding Rho-activating protein-like [Ylistrum balloti]
MASRMKKNVEIWKQREEDHKQKQLINPFSDWEGASHRQALSKDDPRYGRPVEGSKTEYRGKMAGELISSEIIELCGVIANIGQKHSNGVYTVPFGELFEAYTLISNKLVGMLMRARKQKLLDFEGEMLYQRRDDDVIITLYVLPPKNT